ncbi:FAD:protein FMN transferase [Rugosimonospora acidiphila]|uniref:FAD:protein FMN transferase n=1 Tax=Rugosimonospora acidiphila TaxID=556531 RepID=A0ABP9RZA5_9ACTN
MRRVEHVMGMPVSLQLPDLPTAGALAEEAFGWLRHVDAVFSTYREDSEVSRLNRGEIRSPGPEVAAVLDRCADLWRQTDGYFDVYATGRLDPSGYVKGWAVQVASDRLVAGGAADHFLNAGGDLCARGRAAPGAGWRVGVQHPFEPDGVAWVLEVTDRAVATSGRYARGNHIIDPRTGRPATALASVTVLGPELGTADAYATAAFAMGEAGLGWLARLDGHPSAVITTDGRAYRSDDLPVA